MGVKGLWWFLKKLVLDEGDDNKVFHSFDLVKEASQHPDGLTLIVDFYPFEYWIMNQVHNDYFNEQCDKNPWLTISGGEYSCFGDYLVDLVKVFNKCGIKMVVVCSAGRCTSANQMEFKYARWLQTDIRDMKKVHDVLATLEDSDQYICKPNKESKSPTLLPLELTERLRLSGCEVLCCLDGEADPFIAQLYHERKAFAILSNDSDFLLFENCRYINLDESFDVDGVLGQFMRKNEFESGKLPSLSVKAVDSKDVYSILELPNLDAACDLSFILGNDVSKQFPDLYKHLSLFRFSIRGVISRLKKFGPLEKNPLFTKQALSDPNIREAHRMTHELYKIKAPLQGDDNPVNKAICDAVLHCEFAGNCLAISRGFYWQDAKIVETNDSISSLYSAESACLPIRLVLYKMLLSNSEKAEVIEFRPVKTAQLTEKMTISIKQAVENNPALASLPRIDQVREMPLAKRMQLFDHIVNKCCFETDIEKMDEDNQVKIYEQFKWPMAFRVYLCRLTWLLNCEHSNLRLSRSEMESVLASVLAMQDPENAHIGIEAPVKPTRRSLTVGSFLQVCQIFAPLFLKRIRILQFFAPVLLLI